LGNGSADGMGRKSRIVDDACFDPRDAARSEGCIEGCAGG